MPHMWNIMLICGSFYVYHYHALEHTEHMYCRTYMKHISNSYETDNHNVSHMWDMTYLIELVWNMLDMVHMCSQTYMINIDWLKNVDIFGTCGTTACVHWTIHYNKHTIQYSHFTMLSIIMLMLINQLLFHYVPGTYMYTHAYIH